MNHNPWEIFFTYHAPVYMQNGFTKNTEAEVAFILQHLCLPEGAAILDVGCGTGRHSIALARSGFRMTGIDLTEAMLNEARKTADESGVFVEWIQADAASFRREGAFDAALCLCEGAFALLGEGESPLEREKAILNNIFASLKPGALLLLTTLNAYRKIREVTAQQVKDREFDLVELVETESMQITTPEGVQTLSVRSKLYVPAEIRLLLNLTGFQVQYIGGGTAGDWGPRPLTLDEMEMLLIAAKPREEESPQ